MGAYHTIDLELNRDFTLTKTCWDIMSLERIEDACNVAKQVNYQLYNVDQKFNGVCIGRCGCSRHAARTCACMSHQGTHDGDSIQD